ncbi:hypothetical protein O3M35_000983 [Rhynocoris fuscipes]|uniref:Fatty acyl-CoA reductase n=1 Tax=Rhynocoris fuscipes TaxID=488301 RepID=A0AAW1DT15_9HEMI
MSAIASFYKNKTIFISGGTGFIGKLLIEQLLRKTEPRRLYLLIREKKGESSYVRKEKIFQNVVFDHLKATKPNYLEKVSTIPGDLTKKNLGISEEDIERICDETEVVIHGGATVSMSELLKPVIDVNLKGSLSMMALGQKIKNLQAFALISTAYSFCPYPEIKEELNNIHIKPDELINLVDNLTEEFIFLNTSILGKWPNPYTLSKALVETAVKDHAKDLPLAIIRPSIIMGTYSEPVPGWIDNYYGPTGYMSAFATGIVRPVNVNPKEEADLVPGDMVASCTLAAAYKTSLSQ